MNINEYEDRHQAQRMDAEGGAQKHDARPEIRMAGDNKSGMPGQQSGGASHKGMEHEQGGKKQQEGSQGQSQQKRDTRIEEQKSE